MKVWMVQQILSQGMEDGKESNLGSQVLRIAGDDWQCFGAGLEQNLVDRRFVLQRAIAFSCSGMVKTT